MKDTQEDCRGRVVKGDAAGIAYAATVLRRGGLVAFPTETVYGLGANAFDGEAVARVFEAKGRPRFDPLIVHVAEAQAAWALAGAVPQAARRLAAAFWPGPLTLVLPRRRQADERGPAVSELVAAGLSTVGLRVPGHAVARAIIAAAQVPVAAPSANRFGSISPTRAEHVVEELGQQVQVIVDGGPCERGVESTVLSLVGDGQGRGEPTVLRPGGLEREAIEAVIGPVAVARPTSRPGRQSVDAEAGRLSPGMLERHYAPATAVHLVATSSEAAAAVKGRRAGLLAFGPIGEAGRRFPAVEQLSRGGDLREAAANLFAALRRLDAADVEVIFAQHVPEQGLGRAINDRLRRAAAR